MFAAEKYQAEAFKQADMALAWSIERDKVKLLKELGVVGPREDRDGIKLTLEVLGRGYERARGLLGRALDPTLTGQVVDVEHEPLGLDLPQALPGNEHGASTSTIPPEEIVELPAVDPREALLDLELEADVAAALEGPAPPPVQALRGPALDRARLAAED